MSVRLRSALLAATVALAVPASAARAADPVIAAAGDIACGPAETGVFPCQQAATGDLLGAINPTAVLALGDNQYNTGSLADYGDFYDPTWGQLKAITHPVVGNHEYSTPGASGYWDYFNGAGRSNGPAGHRGDGWYSFNVGSWHLIALNSNCNQVGCFAGSPQEEWLKADLKANPTPCTLAFEHAPLWSTPTFADPDVQPLVQDLYDADVELLVVGHDHLYSRFAPSTPGGAVDNAEGVQQIVVGTGGRDFSGLAPQSGHPQVVNNDTFGVLKLTLHPTSYDWQFMPISGETFTDFGSRPCHGNGAPPVPPSPSPAPAPTPSPTPTSPGSASLTPVAPAASPPEPGEDAASASINTVVAVASSTRSRGRLVIRGRLTTGASARALRITLSRRVRGRTVRLHARAAGGRTGSWRAIVTLPRSLRGVLKWSLTVRYLGETGYAPATLSAVLRPRA